MLVRPSAVRRAAARVDQWHSLVLLLAAPFFVFPSPVRTLALLVLPGLWLAAWLAGRPPLPRTPLNAPLLLLSVMLLISLGATFDIAFSLTHLTSVLLGLAAYFALTRLINAPAPLWWAILLFTLLGGGLALVGFVGINWLDKVPLFSSITARLPAFIRGLPGAEEGFSANGVSGALLFIIPLQVALVGQALSRHAPLPPADPLATRPRLWFTVQVLLLALTGGLLLLTQSRSGWTGAAVGLAALLLFNGPKSRRLLFAAAVAILVIVVIASTQAGARTAFLTLIQNINEELGVRRELWLRALYVIRDFPLTGIGVNTFRHVVPLLYPLYRTAVGFNVSHAHNQVLQTAADLGLPGLAAYLGLWAGAAYVLFAAQRATTDPWLRAAAHGLGAGLAAEFVFGLTDAIALGTKLGILFWFTLALAVSLHQVAVTPARPANSHDPAH